MTFPTEWKVIKFHGSSHHQPAVKHAAFWGQKIADIIFQGPANGYCLHVNPYILVG